MQHYYSCKNLQHYSSPWVDNFAGKISFGDRAGKVKHNSYGTLCKYKHFIYLLIPSQVASTLVPVNVTELGIPTIATSDLIIRLHCWLKLINWICCCKKMIRYELSGFSPDMLGRWKSQTCGLYYCFRVAGMHIV